MAVVVKDDKKILVTPVSAEDLKDIHIGDIVYLSGDLTTCRDVAHRRVVEEGREMPVNVKDCGILHAGPIIRPLDNEQYEMVSVGPTTSMRMEKFEYEFVEETGVRVIVGKGGMKENTQRACKDFGAIHIPCWKCSCCCDRSGRNRRGAVERSWYARNLMALSC